MTVEVSAYRAFESCLMNKKPIGGVAFGGLLTFMVALANVGCGKMGNPAAPSDPGAPGASSGALTLTDAAFCVDEVNRFRATVGASPLTASNQIGEFSAEAARVDGAAHETHRHFRQTNGGHGMAKAENEIPWWTLSRYGSVRAIIREGLALEWAEGPGGSHYENMTGPYSEIACGINIQNGEVTITQDFR